MADTPYQYISGTGTVVPDTGDILAEVQAEFQAAFGADIILTADTPQGVLMTAEALARKLVVNNNADLANQINPNIAGGVFLDAICALTGLQRAVATPTTVTCTLTGVAGTVIPAGARVCDDNQNYYQNQTVVVIGTGGNISATFQALETGPTAAPAGTVHNIVDGVIGWEGVTNPTDGMAGQNTQSDGSLRALRRNTMALQGVALPEAITSALYAISTVQSLTFRENITDSSITIDGVTMLPHSIYVCVNGGTDLEVATALLANKSMGANWNGNTLVNIADLNTGQNYPVKFDRPTAVPIIVNVTVKSNTSLVDPQKAVQDAILAYASGSQAGEVGFIVGQAVSPFELSSAINAYYPAMYVKSVTVAVQGGTPGTAEIPVNVSQIATIQRSAINVTLV